MSNHSSPSASKTKGTDHPHTSTPVTKAEWSGLRVLTLFAFDKNASMFNSFLLISIIYPFMNLSARLLILHRNLICTDLNLVVLESRTALIQEDLKILRKLYRIRRWYIQTHFQKLFLFQDKKY